MTESVYGITIPTDLEWNIPFQSWIDRWNSVQDVPTAIGLLHSIYEANKDEERSGRKYDDHRALFLLKLADGHRRNSRSGLATKAFNVLGHYLFRNAHRPRLHDLSAEMKRALLAFFAGGDRDALYGNVRWNDAGTTQSEQVTHADRLASAFMRELCDVVWCSGSDEERVQLIDILHEQDALRTIIPRNYYTGWDRFTEPVMQKLEEVVRSTGDARLGTDTPTPEELIYNGSEAAQVLLVSRAGSEGKARVERRKALKEQMQQNASELAQL
ncbi:MAG: hypothetical protein V4681_02105 [Patescibacteria group bacterium]